MKAITTRFLGPTATKGSRIAASDQDGNRVTITYESHSDTEDAHRKAANTLCYKMGWPTDLASGSIKGGYVFVFLPPVTQSSASAAGLILA